MDFELLLLLFVPVWNHVTIATTLDDSIYTLLILFRIEQQSTAQPSTVLLGDFIESVVKSDDSDVVLEIDKT